VSTTRASVISASLFRKSVSTGALTERILEARTNE
jgi:hypothetical protein